MPPVVLTITANDTASPVLRALQAEVHKLGASGTSATAGLAALSGATQRLSATATTGTGNIHAWKKAQEEAAAAVKKVGDGAAAAAPGVARLGEATGKANTSFLGSAKSALAFGAAVTGVQLSLAAVGNVVQATVGHVVGFQSAMANVNTLGNNSVEVQARLREELLKLPAVLGDSTTLAKGLYEVLSAGIPAADAVAFLGTSASLAKAGLADVNTTTQALTKTMAAFAIPTKDAGQLADVLFKVVDLGQGSLQQFAGAFPQVTQGAAAMGLSFKDTAAGMATLTQTFRNADTAATGFRSLLSQLVTNSDKFRAAGIDIQKVIGEQGMAGVLRVLQELTGGNVEKMRLYINDVEGLAAAQALTGPQFKLFLENQKKLDESLGVVTKGLKIQSATAQSTYDEMVADAGKAAIALAPPFLAAFTMIAKGARLYADDVNAAFASIKPIVTDTADFFTRMFSSAGKGADNLTKANSALVQGMLDIMGMTVRVDEATRHATLGTQLAATETDEFKTATTVLSDSLTKGKQAIAETTQATAELEGELATVRGSFDTAIAACDLWSDELDLSGISAEAAAANYRKLEPALDAIAGAHAEAAREAAGFGTILQRNIDLADLTLESTLKLNEGLRKASFQQDFAKDELGLQKQLAVAYKELSAAQQLGTQEGQARAKTLLKEIETLKAKLGELQQTQTTQLTTATAQTQTLTAATAQLTTQIVAAGRAAAGAAGAAGNFPLMGGGRGKGGPFPDFAPGGRLPPGSRGAQPMPLRPGSAPGNQRPPGWNVPGRPIQRFAEGGIVQGSGGIDSVPAMLTPGERVLTPGQDRAISVSFGSITVNVQGGSSGNPVEMGRAAAQAFVREMAPALNESLSRGKGRFA